MSNMRRGLSKPEEPQLQMFKNDFERELNLKEKEVDDREKAVSKIVTDLKDIHQIMQDLSALTYQQGEIIDHIGNNIETTYENTSKANVELTKAKDSISLCSIQ